MQRFLFLISLTILFVAYPQNQKSLNGFRNAQWGMSKKDVLKTEKSNPVDKRVDYITYEGSIINLKSTIIFSFIDNKLVTGTYLIEDVYISNDLYLDDYYKLKTLLTEKYGFPIHSDVVWLNESFKGDKAYLNMAIGMGHVKYVSLWQIDKTNIMLTLSGNQMKATLSIYYASREFQAKINEQVHNQSMDGL